MHTKIYVLSLFTHPHVVTHWATLFLQYIKISCIYYLSHIRCICLSYAAVKRFFVWWLSLQRTARAGQTSMQNINNYDWDCHIHNIIMRIRPRLGFGAFCADSLYIAILTLCCINNKAYTIGVKSHWLKTCYQMLHSTGHLQHAQLKTEIQNINFCHIPNVIMRALL